MAKTDTDNSREISLSGFDGHVATAGQCRFHLITAHSAHFL